MKTPEDQINERALENQQRIAHTQESDNIVEHLKELIIVNKIMHDELSEAQAMIGDLKLTNARQALQSQNLRNQLLMLITRDKR